VYDAASLFLRESSVTERAASEKLLELLSEREETDDRYYAQVVASLSSNADINLADATARAIVLYVSYNRDNDEYSARYDKNVHKSTASTCSAREYHKSIARKNSQYRQRIRKLASATMTLVSSHSAAQLQALADECTQELQRDTAQHSLHKSARDKRNAIKRAERTARRIAAQQ
jgi:hypothetical protein